VRVAKLQISDHNGENGIHRGPPLCGVLGFFEVATFECERRAVCAGGRTFAAFDGAGTNVCRTRESESGDYERRGNENGSTEPSRDYCCD
jgi:hypothetical protein